MAESAIRRIVTTHDKQGRAVVMIDDQPRGKPAIEKAVVTEIWETSTVPVDNKDETNRLTGAGTYTTGCALRYVDFEPGFRSEMHKTPSMDFAFVIDGSMDMELDGGQTVNLKAGDIVVQRGTYHRWMNNGDVPCRIAFVMIASKDGWEEGKTRM